jgi:DNA modification methylase
MAKGLSHKQITEDSTLADVAGADYLLMFRKVGENKAPVTHATGLQSYAGERTIPEELQPFKNWSGKQTENRYSHWIWRQYASSFWDDIRIGRVLPYEETREKDDERHVHPLQLDVIDRIVELYSNPGEVVLTPFMGVGSEVYSPVSMGRKAIGIELKDSYYKQAKINLSMAGKRFQDKQTQQALF